jgi:putative transposase
VVRDLVLDALKQALPEREIDETLVQHRDRGVPSLSLRDTARWAAVGITASVDSTGDAYDGGRAESRPTTLHA